MDIIEKKILKQDFTKCEKRKKHDISALFLLNVESQICMCECFQDYS